MTKRSEQVPGEALKAEKKKEETAPIRITAEEKGAILERMRVAKGEGLSFNAFFEELAVEIPQLKATTVYQWWLGIVVDGNASANGAATVSERLAALLRKEGILEGRIKAIQKQLDAVRTETTELWAKRAEA